METSVKGRQFLTKEEGEKLKAYKDSVGVWTIGVGHTSAAGLPKVTQGLVITKAESQAIFARDLVKFEKVVSTAVKVPLNQNQFDALVSLCYNIGPTGFKTSQVVKALNAGNYKAAGDFFLNWSRAGKNATLLANRRKRERDLFNSKAPSVVKNTSRATTTAVEASKDSPIATGAVISGGGLVASQILPSIGSWEAVAGLGLLIVAAAIGWFVYKHLRDKNESNPSNT